MYHVLLYVKEVGIRHNRCMWKLYQNRCSVRAPYLNDYSTSCTDPQRYRHGFRPVLVSLQNLPLVLPVGLSFLVFLERGYVTFQTSGASRHHHQPKSRIGFRDEGAFDNAVVAL